MQIDDFICLTKIILQDTTNTKHKQLAQTIFTKPNMTLGRAASLFETYNPPSGPAAAPPTPTVNAVTCRYCKGKDHKLSYCPKKSLFPIKRGLKNPVRLLLHGPGQQIARGFQAPFAIPWITCLTCVLVVRKPEGVLLSPPAGRIHHLTARTGSPLSGGARQSEAGGVMTKSRRVLSDGVVSDEVAQLRSLRKLRLCL